MLRSKYKQIQDKNSTDSIYSLDFQATERQLGKKQCKDGVLDAEIESMGQDDLYFNVEMILAERCSVAETVANSTGVEYECTCPKIEDMTQEELQDLYDKLRLNITPV